MNPLIEMMIGQSAGLIVHTQSYVKGMPSISNSETMKIAIGGHVGYLISMYFISRGINLTESTKLKLHAIVRDESFTTFSNEEIYNKTRIAFTE